MKFIAFTLLSLFCLNLASAQNWSLKASVLLSTTLDESKRSITIRWNQEPLATRYMIFRKTKEAKAWGVAIGNLPGDALFFTDTSIQIGQAYEYRVSRSASDIGANGYIYGGIKVPAVEPKKTILLLVDNRVKDSLTAEISRLKSALENESWHVLQSNIPTTMTVPEVKNLIKTQRTSFPLLSTVFIIGHVPVPYSGNSAWDGHPDHAGAWPSETYYADMDGGWTDVSLNNTVGSRAETKNIPGDGKFDQSQIPNDVELEVGRVDFYNMPDIKKSEITLLRNYLNKNYLFRTGKIKAKRKAVVQDNFNFMGEFFGSTGYRNASAFFGPDSVISGSYRDLLLADSYLWSYGAGGGSYTSAGGISNTTLMGTDSLRGIFTVLFGSYFGDWDSPNNFLRSPLASGTMLTCVWAGRPGWQFHHMAMGEHIGYSHRLSTNNNGALYNVSPTALRGTHMGLMGDPSLNMYPMQAPTGLLVKENKENIDLSWQASPDATAGYTILRKFKSETQYKIVARNLNALTYNEKCLTKDSTYEYLVCASKLETNASGSFYMLSPGVKGSVTIKDNHVAKADFQYVSDYEFFSAKATSLNALGNTWIADGKTFNRDSLNLVLDCKTNPLNLTLIANSACNVDTVKRLISYVCSVPEIVKTRITPDIKCFGEVTNIYLDSIRGAAPFTFAWSNGSTKSSAEGVSGKVTVIIKSKKATADTMTFNLPQFAELIIDSIHVKGVNTGFNKGKILKVDIQGGTPPYIQEIVGNFDPDFLEPGEYTLKVIDDNGCVTVRRFIIKLNVGQYEAGESHAVIYPSPAKDYVLIQFSKWTTLPKDCRLQDVHGREFHPEITSPSVDVMRLDLRNLPSGWYQILSPSTGLRRGFMKI